MLKKKISYTKAQGIPPKNRLIMAIFLLKFPLVFPPIKWLVKKYLRHCHNIGFYPGFTCLYGNIHARNVFLGNTVFFDYAPIYIGEKTMFSYDNMVITSSHQYEKDFTVTEAEPIYIGKNVWISTRCIILGGVRIGDNAVIGSGSVVTHDIPANCLVAGNPAKIIKRLAKKYNAAKKLR